MAQAITAAIVAIIATKTAIATSQRLLCNDGLRHIDCALPGAHGRSEHPLLPGRQPSNLHLPG